MTMTYDQAHKRAEELKAIGLQRDLTAEEIAETKTVVAELEGHRKRIRRNTVSPEVFAQLAGEKDSGYSDYDGQPKQIGMRAGRATSPWAEKVAAQLRNAAASAGGQKVMMAGEYHMPEQISEIEEMPGRATTLLDLVPRYLPRNNMFRGNSFSYIRQTVRDNRAVIVPDGELKPTSVYTFEQFEEKSHIIAHLSEALPNHWFSDVSWLVNWLSAEMEYGVRLALEYQIVNGRGVIPSGSPGGPTDEFTGILNVSGRATQTFDTDILRTTRRAITKLENKGIKPTAFVFAPTDAEELDLAQDDISGYYGNGPFTAGPDTLWGIPRVTSTALLPGTAILADWNTCQIIAVEPSMTISVDTTGTLFERNQTRMRAEGRYGFAIYQPGAFVEIYTAEFPDDDSSSAS